MEHPVFAQLVQGDDAQGQDEGQGPETGDDGARGRGGLCFCQGL